MEEREYKKAEEEKDGEWEDEEERGGVGDVKKNKQRSLLRTCKRRNRKLLHLAEYGGYHVGGTQYESHQRKNEYCCRGNSVWRVENKNRNKR